MNSTSQAEIECKQQATSVALGARIVFIGTPAISVPTLLALANSPLKPIAVITESDKPVGRKKILTAPAIKVAAQTLSIPVYQPETSAELFETITKLKPTLGVVIAYGRILKTDLLAIPPFGFLNLHFSLLPKYRGATPIQAAILNGESETGVTLMKIDEGLDTGPILGYSSIKIESQDTAGLLGEKLADLAAKLATELIPHYLHGEIRPKAQPDSTLSVTKKLTKEAGQIDWDKPVKEIERFIRAMNPWPKAWTEAAGERFILHQVHLENSLLVIDQIQAAGGKIISGKEFARGFKNALTELKLTGKVSAHS